MRKATRETEQVAHQIPMVENEAGGSSSIDRRIKARPILKAKRQMAKKTTPVVLINQEIPKTVRLIGLSTFQTACGVICTRFLQYSAWCGMLSDVASTETKILCR